MNWIICYYLTEQGLRTGAPDFKEEFHGDRNAAINWAQNKMKYGNFKFYELKQK